MNPRFPVYIVSKGRSESRLTVRALERIHIDYRIIVERHEYEDYRRYISDTRILILDEHFRHNYSTCDSLGLSKSTGPGPARNFAWEHSISIGAAWHWVLDDNIAGFCRFNDNKKIVVSDGTIFACMEDFCLRYGNIALAGPSYESFIWRRNKWNPITINSSIFSALLIRNDIGFRWRARYNEDTDLCLRVMKFGWCIVRFNTFLQQKVATQTMKGGCNDDFYSKEGTFPKSRMLVSLHPDFVRLVFKFGRWHHKVDYKSFKRNKLIKKEGLAIPSEPNEYGMKLITLPKAP